MALTVFYGDLNMILTNRMTFLSAGNAISKHLEGPSYPKFSLGLAPEPPGGAYSAPRPPI